MTDPILLQCDLGKSGDAQNSLRIYDRRLVVIFKGKSSDFPLESIKGLSINRKKLIIPLVLGGIGTSLSWLALRMGWYHYQTNLFLVFLFFGWMYYGFIGKDGLEIIEGKTPHLYLIKTNHLVLNSFLKFTRERIFMPPPAMAALAFHWVPKADWEAQLHSVSYTHPSLKEEGFIHASFLSEIMTTYNKYFSPTEPLVLLGIDLHRVEAEVKVVHVVDRQADFPHIYGPLNKSAIVWLRNVRDAQDFDMKTIA